jgi:uncharacterized coiled-coil DUF342 family protein
MTFNEGHNAALMTGLERAYELRIAELERRLAEMEKMYDKVAADLIEALDVASAYRATASTMHQEIERRNGVERRQHTDFGAALRRIEDARDAGRTNAPERRKSWPR